MGGELPRVTSCHTKAIVKYQKKRLLYTMLQSTSMRDSDTRTDYQGTQELFVVNSVKCFFFFSTLMQLSCIQKTLAQRTKIKAPSIIIPLPLIKYNY